jgi:hypothetical protein
VVRIAIENTTHYIALLLEVLMAKTGAVKKAKKTSLAKTKSSKAAHKAVKVTKVEKPKLKAASKVMQKPAKVEKPTKLKIAPKTQEKATSSQVALKKEVSKKKLEVSVKPPVNVPEVKPGADAEEPLLPGVLSKQQVKSLEKLIQKNAEWSLISGVLQLNARPYKMQEAYKEKMAIKHPVMGLGYVTVAENHKMTVLFKDGTKNLIMNYKA